MKETICTAFGLVGSFMRLCSGMRFRIGNAANFYWRGLCNRLDGSGCASGVKSGSFTAIGMKRTAASDDAVATWL